MSEAYRYYVIDLSIHQSNFNHKESISKKEFGSKINFQFPVCLII